MRHKLILSFLFLEVIAHCAGAARARRNDETLVAPTKFRDDQSVVARTFVPISPGQIRHAEVTVQRFLAKLGLIARPPTLSSDRDDPRRMIREICEIVRARVTEFARACGLIESVRRYERTSWHSAALSEDWLSEGLVRGSLLLCDLLGLGEEVRFAIDRYLDTYNITLPYNRELSPRKTATGSFEFLGAVNGAFVFNERLFKCLRSMRGRRPGAFDLNRVLANLARGPPNSTVTAFKSVLDRALARYAPNNDATSGRERLYASLCRSLVERAGRDRGDCVEQLRRLEDCALRPARQDFGEAIAGRASPVESLWSTAVEDLSGCKIVDIDASVRCDFGRRVPGTTVRRVEYIYEKILDRRIPRRSLLRRVANELGDVLARSEWGRRFAYDLCRYIAIYLEGRRRLNVLSRDAARSKKAASRYRKISKSLNSYKNGVLRRTVLAIGKFHRSALEMQKFLIRGSGGGAAFKQSWHLDILDCLSDWMTKVLELFGCAKLDDADVDASIPTNVSAINATDSVGVMTSDDFYDGSDRIEHPVTYRTKDQIKRETDEAFERLLRSMSRVSSVRSENDRSTLACLSNNLLLVTMFMETISLVSTLFCLGKGKSESNAEELKEEWAPPERKRRSTVSSGFCKN